MSRITIQYNHILPIKNIPIINNTLVLGDAKFGEKVRLIFA
jgi:hypothetical protein